MSRLLKKGHRPRAPRRLINQLEKVTDAAGKTTVISRLSCGHLHETCFEGNLWPDEINRRMARLVKARARARCYACALLLYGLGWER